MLDLRYFVEVFLQCDRKWIQKDSGLTSGKKRHLRKPIKVSEYIWNDVSKFQRDGLLFQYYNFWPVDRESLHLNGRVYGTYVTTVFLLDTSASMAGKGLEQMKTAFKDIIHGMKSNLQKKLQNNILYNRYLNVQNSFKIVVWTEFSQHPSITENVTVITCGRDVKILQYYSTNYTKISECVGNAF